MKHIKTYEGLHFPILKNEIEETHEFGKSLKKGDYVIIKCTDTSHYYADNEPMILAEDAALGSNGFTVAAYRIGDSIDTSKTFYDYEVVRLATQEEIELQTLKNSADKYNL